MILIEYFVKIGGFSGLNPYKYHLLKIIYADVEYLLNEA